MTDTELRQVYLDTKSVYEKKAKDWHSLRAQTLFEKPFLDRFITLLPAGASLLDLGCGTGIAISDYFMKAGFKITGLDYSQSMIALAKLHYPDGKWLVQDIRDIQLKERFDGVYSWHGFFHLSVQEQKEALPKISNLVKSGGSLMLTVGTTEGEVTGRVGGETVYHASLHPGDYLEQLKSLGFKSVKYLQDSKTDQGPYIIMASEKS
jgi:2-polyprenyl-3-methyl-5-hydroxy-6-metoxy-1,4-benzoquinol methylase